MGTDTDTDTDTSTGTGSDSDDLRAEREHLRRSRRALEGMRDEAEQMDIAGGDPVVDKVTIAHLRMAKERRVASFAEESMSAPLFFGRVEYAADAPLVPGQRFYLGRRHVRESAGDDPLVVDWRTDVARPFYRAHPADPMGLTTRRRFGYDGAELTAFEDEPLAGPAGSAASSVLLEREIERPRAGPMRDIVATIQPEQDEIVRAGLDVSVCVQGAPGTGKTAVGLHRAAYLLYTYRERLRRSGVLVVGPNRAFLGYIATVLPTLGEFTVTQRSLDGVLDTVTVRGTDPDEVAALKGDARMATVIHRALYGAVGTPTGPVTVGTGMGRWTVGTDEIEEILATLRSGSFRYGTGRALLGRRIAAAVRRRAEATGRYFTDGALETLARSRPVREAVEAIWPRTDGPTLVHRLFTDQPFLASAADGILTAAEQQLLLRPGQVRSARGARWSLPDAFCIDETQDLIEEMPGYGHVVVDEAQDLSAMQCRALGRRCRDGSLTVLGDLAQGTTIWATTSWTTTLAHLGKQFAHTEVLTRGYRVPAEILAFANRLLPHIAPDLAPATSARTVPGALALARVAPDLLAAEVTERARRALKSEGSIAVLAAERFVPVLATALRDAGLTLNELRDNEAPGRASLVTASLAKGLEFDHVIVVDPVAIVSAEAHPTQGLRRLYVVLTRAVTALTVVHAGDLPQALR